MEGNVTPPLLARPPVLTVMSTPTPRRAGATSTASFPLPRLPTSTTRRGWRVQTTLQTLAMAKGTDEVRGREAKVHEVAEAAPIAFAVLVLTTARFPEVNGRPVSTSAHRLRIAVR